MPLQTARQAANVGGEVRCCVGGAVCHFVVEQVFSGAFEEAIRWCGCGVMETGHSFVVHARLCSVQRMSPNRMCAQMQDEAQRRVEHCIGFGSCSVAY